MPLPPPLVWHPCSSMLPSGRNCATNTHLDRYRLTVVYERVVAPSAAAAAAATRQVGALSCVVKLTRRRPADKQTGNGTHARRQLARAIQIQSIGHVGCRVPRTANLLLAAVVVE